MSDAAAPPPLPYESPPPPPRRAAAVVAWLVILASASYIIATTAFEKSAQSAAGGRRTSEIQFRVAARYAVGVSRLLSGLDPSGRSAQATSLLSQIDEAAAGPDERLRAAIVAGEIAGRDAAVKRLDQFPLEAGSAGGDDLTAVRKIYEAGSAEALSPARRQALSSAHGWFGRLALTHGLPADHPERRAALRPALRAALLTFAAAGAGLAGLLAGLALLIVALVRVTGPGLAAGYRAPVAPTVPFLEAFAAYIAGMVAVSALARLLLGGRMGAMWFVVVILPATFLWPLLRGVSPAELRAGLGWHSGRGFWREVGAGVVGYLAALPVMAAGMVVTLILQRLSRADTAHPIINELGRDAGRTLQLFFLAAMWAPVVEETMFRGALYHHLRRKLHWTAAAALVALLFAAVHPQGWAAVPLLGAIGFAFAGIREWRGSIIAPVVAHAINNGAVTILFVLLLS